MKGTHLNMNEEELQQKEKELQEREEALQKRETELQEKEADLEKRKADLDVIVANMTKQYEAKMKKQEDDFKAQIKERDNIIDQLLNAEGGVDNKPKSIDSLIDRRKMQRRG